MRSFVMCLQATDTPGPEGRLGQSENPGRFGQRQWTAEAALPGNGCTSAKKNGNKRKKNPSAFMFSRRSGGHLLTCDPLCFPAGGDRQRSWRRAEGGRPAVAPLALSALRQTSVSGIPSFLPLAAAETLSITTRCHHTGPRTRWPTDRAAPPTARRLCARRGRWRSRMEPPTPCPKTSRRKDPGTRTRTSARSRNVSPVWPFVSRLSRTSLNLTLCVSSFLAAKYIKCEQCGNPKVRASSGGGSTCNAFKEKKCFLIINNIIINVFTFIIPYFLLLFLQVFFLMK